MEHRRTYRELALAAALLAAIGMGGCRPTAAGNTSDGTPPPAVAAGAPHSSVDNTAEPDTSTGSAANDTRPNTATGQVETPPAWSDLVPDEPDGSDSGDGSSSDDSSSAVSGDTTPPTNATSDGSTSSATAPADSEYFPGAW